MNIWELDKLILFILVVFPGFISLITYDLIIPSDKRDFSKSIINIIAYSVLNFGILSWLISIISEGTFASVHPVIYYFSIFLIFVFFPIIWPFIFIKVSKSKVFKSLFISPSLHPWNLVFSKREARWVIVHLKGNKKIRGVYGMQSSASAYTTDRMIYLEKVWTNSSNGFGEPIENSDGVIIFDNEIEYIEFLK